MEADKGHLHHRLMKLGYGQRRATLMLYGVSAIMGIAAVMFSRHLYVEACGLVAVAVMDVYIFLTDPNHLLPQIRNEREEKERARQAALEATAAEETVPAQSAVSPQQDGDGQSDVTEEDPPAEEASAAIEEKAEGEEADKEQ